MANSYFEFKQFRVEQDRCAMKVTTDACVFGAWVAEQIRLENSSPKTILDIGSGTGLLSLMIAQAVPDVEIDSIEIDTDAALQAVENISSSPWKERIRIQQGDVLQLEKDFRYDRIVSNPPFYEQELTGPDKKKNQAHHHESLPFSQLIDRLHLHLMPAGKFYLLLPEKGIQKRIDQLRDMGMCIHQKVSFQHSDKHAVSRIFLQGGKSESDTVTTEQLILQKEDGSYTERIRSLLQAYYLYL